MVEREHASTVERPTTSQARRVVHQRVASGSSGAVRPVRDAAPLSKGQRPVPDVHSASPSARKGHHSVSTALDGSLTTRAMKAAPARGWTSRDAGPGPGTTMCYTPFRRNGVGRTERG